MVQGTMPGDLEILIDGDDPTEPGDVKVVRPAAGLIEINDCDSSGAWSVASSTGSFSVITYNKVEGSGSLLAIIPAQSTIILKTTGSWDLSASKHLRFWGVTVSGATLSTCGMYFGESTYNESTSPTFSITDRWGIRSWDFSSVSSSNRDGVTAVAIEIQNSATYERWAMIDYVHADPGPCAVKAYDGDTLINLFPKVVIGSYTGDGTTGKVVYLASSSDAVAPTRTGTPSAIFVNRSTSYNTRFWSKGMESGYSITVGSNRTSDGIWEVGDGYFKVGSTQVVNNNGDVYLFTALFDDTT